jgi:hypothetical protein
MVEFGDPPAGWSGHLCMLRDRNPSAPYREIRRAARIKARTPAARAVA